MKKILLLLIVLFVSTYSFCQTTVKSYKASASSSKPTAGVYQGTYDSNLTTEEEYDYITKELKIQMEGSFDMRKGYELKTVKVMTSYQKRAELGQLIRTGDKSIACYWLKFTHFKTYYFCLPNPHSTTDMMNKCNSDLMLGMNTQSLSMTIITLLSGLQWQDN